LTEIIPSICCEI